MDGKHEFSPSEVVTVEIEEMWHYLKKICQAWGVRRLWQLVSAIVSQTFRHPNFSRK